MRHAPTVSLVFSIGFASALALAGCAKPQPSPEYREARERFQAAAARSPLDPYSQPEMAEVLELLARVPKESLDAEAAAQLRDRILDERKRLAEEETRRKELLEGAGRPSAPIATGGGGGEGGPGAGGAAAAGQLPAGDLAVGTALSAFQATYGHCFERRGSARIGDQPGEAWALKDDPACKKDYPGAEGRLVLFADGKLLQARLASEAKQVEVKEKVEGIRMPDGTIAVKGPDGQPRPLPEGAKVTWQQPPAESAARTAAPAAASGRTTAAPAPRAPGAAPPAAAPAATPATRYAP